MAYSEGQLNGSADYRVGINIYLVSQNQGGNYSTYYWEVLLQNPNSWGSWTNSPSYWSANLGGNPRSGSFATPQSEGATKTRVIANGYVDIGHDAEGFRAGFPSDAYIDTPHSSIGDGGSGQAWVDAPRIPKVPGKPVNGTVSNITNSNIRLNGTPPDNRGAAIVEYQFSADPTGTGSTVLKLHNGQILDVGGLVPGTQYRMQYRARNSVGWGPWSDGVLATTLAGVYVGNGSAWVAQALQVGNGSAWVSLSPEIGDGDSWEDPIQI